MNEELRTTKCSMIVNIIALSMAVLIIACSYSYETIRTGPQMAPVRIEEVKIYTSTPEDIIELGTIKAKVSFYDEDLYGCYSVAMPGLKSRAAQLGANGIIVYPQQEELGKWERLEPTPMSDHAETQTKKEGVEVYCVIRAKAVRVPK